MKKRKSALPFVLGLFILILITGLIGFCEWRVKNAAFEDMRILKPFDEIIEDRDVMVIKWPFSGKPIVE